MKRETGDGSWAALVQADRDRNAGMPIELLNAEVYANREGLTREEYVIKVLRAERDRRQAEDRIASDHVLLDEVIDSAHAEGIAIVEYVTSGAFLPRLGPRRTWDINPDFLAQLLTRLQERMADGSLPEGKANDRADHQDQPRGDRDRGAPGRECDPRIPGRKDYPGEGKQERK
jgi:hypothetical protein